MSIHTRAITVFGSTFDVPGLLSPKLAQLKDELRERRELIRSGQRQRPPVMGLIPRLPEQLTPKDRFHELERLEKEYAEIIEHLRHVKSACETFIADLNVGVRKGVLRQCNRARALEEKRLEVMAQGASCHDETLIDGARRSGERLGESVQLLGLSTILVLRKLEVCRTSVVTLAQHQEKQRLVLERLVRRLKAHRAMLELDEEISRFRNQQADSQVQDLDFEAYLKEAFGPIRSLLEQAAAVDATFHRAVDEIQSVTGDLTAHRRELFNKSTRIDRDILETLSKEPFDAGRAFTSLREAAAADAPITAGFGTAQAPEVGGGSVLAILRNVERLIAAVLNESSELDETRQSHEVELAELHELVLGGKETDPHEEIPVASANPIELPREPNFVEIYTGTFLMGSPLHEVGRYAREVQHRVTLTIPFLSQMTPVTQEEFEEVMGYNPSHFKHPNRPVERVSWHEAAAYCNRKSEQVGLPRCYLEAGSGPRVQCSNDQRFPSPSECHGYRLPTEAEWEYAARAGSTMATFAGDLLESHLSSGGPNPVHDGIAWFFGNAGVGSHRVGLKKPNDWGLYDALGNVLEWCHDWFEKYANSAATDPPGPPRGSLKVVRGGSFRKLARCCRAAYRDGLDPREKADDLGFRVVRSIDSFTS